jgi:hypothetical protein
MGVFVLNFITLMGFFVDFFFSDIAYTKECLMYKRILDGKKFWMNSMVKEYGGGVKT